MKYTNKIEKDLLEFTNEAKEYNPEKRRKLKTGEVEVMKGKGSRQKWFYLKNQNDVKQLIKLGRNSAFPTGITNNNSRLKFNKSLDIKESVNEARSTNIEWNKFEKAFGDFFKTVLRLGKANTKLTGNKTDEKIFIKNFNRDVGKFYSLMQSWVRGQNESVNEKMDKEQFHDYMQYVLKTQFKTPEEKKMKKSIIKKLNIANKKKGLRLFKEISGVQLAKKVVKNQQYEKGMDLFTAQYIVQTYDAYKKHPTLRKKIEKLSIAKAVKLANLVMRGS